MYDCDTGPHHRNSVEGRYQARAYGHLPSLSLAPPYPFFQNRAIMNSIINRARLTIAGSTSPIGGASRPHPPITSCSVAAIRPVSPIGEAGRFIAQNGPDVRSAIVLRVFCSRRSTTMNHSTIARTLARGIRLFVVSALLGVRIPAMSTTDSGACRPPT